MGAVIRFLPPGVTAIMITLVTIFLAITVPVFAIMLAALWQRTKALPVPRRP